MKKTVRVVILMINNFHWGIYNAADGALLESGFNSDGKAKRYAEELGWDIVTQSGEHQEALNEDKRQALIDAVIESIKEDIFTDCTVLEELLTFLSDDQLIDSLPEEQQKQFLK